MLTAYTARDLLAGLWQRQLCMHTDRCTQGLSNFRVRAGDMLHRRFLEEKKKLSGFMIFVVIVVCRHHSQSVDERLYHPLRGGSGICNGKQHWAGNTQ